MYMSVLFAISFVLCGIIFRDLDTLPGAGFNVVVIVGVVDGWDKIVLASENTSRTTDMASHI